VRRCSSGISIHKKTKTERSRPATIVSAAPQAPAQAVAAQLFNV
jgi:hypothetical protein